jgi:myo-inositol 2-dehydrogenase / D-chiro-inositol 1-dehydrogenase
MLPNASTQRLTRRQFLARSSASALALPVLAPQVLHGAATQPKIRFALIGCGGRGRWIGRLFHRHGGFECTAVHDYFPDRAEAAGNDLNVPGAARFSGLSSYRQALEQQVDAAIIISPPYFHPEQMAVAVDAGQHVYLAKPLAVDVPGCLTIADLGYRASQKRLAVLVDFQTRAMPDYQTAIGHVHDGMIGRIGLAEATYHCGNTFDAANQALKADPANPELRMRAWGLDAALSGDVITEQNIHALDVASWILNTEPIKAYGTCAHTRGFAGTCHDTWAVIFYYPNQVLCSFNAKQFGHGYDDILCRVYGTNGTIETHYGGRITVRARDDGFQGSSPNIYEQGAVNNIETFHRAITTGDYTNPTVEDSVRSNLVTLLGRAAAYRKTEVTWAELLRERERLEFDTSGLKA